MPIGNQIVQQAVVVSGQNSMQYGKVPVRFALFNEDGTPFTGGGGGGGSLPSDVDFLGVVAEILDGP